MKYFPWCVRPGDKVYWNDPDGGCSRPYTIKTIEYYGLVGDTDCIFHISEPDGSELECYARELSRLEHAVRKEVK